MSPRRLLALSLASVLPVAVGLAAYLVFTWPHRKPQYDGKQPVSLRVRGTRGIRMYLDPKDSVITPTIFETGSWEADETDWFVRTVQPGDTVVDAGANVGYYTLIASRLVGEKGKVYAFEPDPANFELLRRNVELNRLKNVVLEQKALSNRKGTIKLFLARSNKGDHRIYQPGGESRPSVDVEAVRLDEYFKGRERVDVVKIDTQGAEGLILEGMTGLLEGRTDGPTIFMEFWPHALREMGTDPVGLLEMLQTYHYRFREFSPKASNGLQPVEAADLLAVYAVETSHHQTNLMVLRGGASR
jgi:FkbM family methyltransferase